MKRVCVNCGIEITFIQSLFNNKCCSYKCDLESEEKTNLYERKVWEEAMESKLKDIKAPTPKRRYKEMADNEDKTKEKTKKGKEVKNVEEEKVNKIKEEKKRKEEEEKAIDEFVIENIQKDLASGVFEEFIDDTDNYEFIGAPEEEVPGEELNF